MAITQFVTANNVNTQLAAAASSTATTLTLASSSNLPTLTTGQAMPLTLNDAATGQNYEIVYVTAITGVTLTVVRGQEGTGALNWSVGDYAFCPPTAGTTATALGNPSNTFQVAAATVANQAPQLGQVQSGAATYAVDTGTANTYTVAFTPAITAVTDGLKLRFKAKTANTGASTFSPNGLTAAPIWGAAHSALQGGEIVANSDVELVWNSSLNTTGAWVLLESTGGPLQVAPATASQHAVQLGQVMGAYAVRGLTAQNNATTPTTQFDIGCNLVVLRNPTIGNLQTVNNPSTITNNISTAGPAANGRDQSAAFPASNWVHFYYIWNGTTLATISSLSAPPTGPTLPSGYTHWAYVGAVILNGSSQLNSVHMRGSRVRYDGIQNSVVGGSATSQTAVGLNPLIPPNALTFTLSIRELAGSADGTGKLDLVLHLGVISGTDIDAKHFGIAGVTAGTSQFSAPGTVELPNVGQNYYYYMTQANGTGPSTTHLVLGYTVPNGDA